MAGAGVRAAAAEARPVEDAEFARLMAALGPFEPSPAIAVAVSGGVDSLCLALLLERWSRARDGRLLALIVDHGLRPESAAEAARARARLAARGIEARILSWTGPKPESGIQAAARAARYRLLAAACARVGIVHLALAHHRDDQCETHLLRAAAGSGPYGLAAMAAVVEGRGLRLIRPLLAVPGRRLRATGAAAGLAWDEDPSNRDPRFARARLRAGGGAADADGLAVRIAELGLARADADRRIAALLVRALRLDPAGSALVDLGALAAAPPETALAALARILCTVSGSLHPPRTARLGRLMATLDSAGLPGRRTLGGCLLVPAAGGRMLVCREPAAIVPAAEVRPGETLLWDGRFTVRLGNARSRRGPLSVRAVDATAWRRLARAAERSAYRPAWWPPAVVRAALPVLCDLDGPLALPHLIGCQVSEEAKKIPLAAWFTPRLPATSAAFAAVAT